MSGYSGTPLIKKLGIKQGFTLQLINAPRHYLELIGELPPNVLIVEQPIDSVDFIHVFVKSVAELEAQLPILKDQIVKNGIIWVSWYKKSAKIPTDVNEDIIRDTALALGLVDVKVCAVDEQWSGLKLVWRKENR
ncbi:MAG: hypothetical protein SFU99_02125 [Saprospiraceae bacterium]|nr:hypothetical protein [Saprospiraceae bacterium]